MGATTKLLSKYVLDSPHTPMVHSRVVERRGGSGGTPLWYIGPKARFFGKSHQSKKLVHKYKKLVYWYKNWPIGTQIFENRYEKLINWYKKLVLWFKKLVDLVQNLVHLV